MKPLKFSFCAATIVAVFFASCSKDKVEPPVAVPAFAYQSSTLLEFGIPLTVDFQDQSTNLESSEVYVWDFGDGKISTERNPSHTYAAGGSYVVKLTLTNSARKSAEITKTVDLTSPLIGTWQLDSLAPASIDSFATKKGIKTAIEFGKTVGWDGKKWTAVSGTVENGYSPFWSNVIFKGNYLGRKAFFAVKYTFNVNGEFKRKENGTLPGAVFFSPERDYQETEDWRDVNGNSLNTWKSGTFAWAMSASTAYTGRTDLKITGNGGFVGLYFAGSQAQVPASNYTYTIASVTSTSLVIAGVSDLFGPTDTFVLKFKRVQ